MCREGVQKAWTGMHSEKAFNKAPAVCVGGAFEARGWTAAEHLRGFQRVLASPGGSRSCPADGPIRAERAGLTRRRSR